MGQLDGEAINGSAGHYLLVQPGMIPYVRMAQKETPSLDVGLVDETVPDNDGRQEAIITGFVDYQVGHTGVTNGFATTIESLARHWLKEIGGAIVSVSDPAGEKNPLEDCSPYWTMIHRVSQRVVEKALSESD